MQDEALMKITEMEEAVGKLESEVERSILVMRYFECRTFRDIAKNVPYSERTVYNYHANALEHLEMPDEGTEI